LSYSDARGDRVAVREFNTIGASTSLSTLTTRYAYDPLGQLLGVTDTKGNVVSAEYDSLGQMVALTSPDSGRTEYRYDLAGNVGGTQIAVLAEQKNTRRLQDE